LVRVVGKYHGNCADCFCMMTINCEEPIYEISIVVYYDIFIMNYSLFGKYCYTYGNSVATYSRIMLISCIYDVLQVKNMGSTQTHFETGLIISILNLRQQICSHGKKWDHILRV
jgi:hypothetical protein